tara:strand:- start:1251 stop:1373 length:123 start_codon:yes stop_codon:yes gene_type:complete
MKKLVNLTGNLANKKSIAVRNNLKNIYILDAGKLDNNYET